MGMSPIDCDVILMFYFNILGQRQDTYEHDNLFDILDVSQLHMIYTCLFVLGVETKAHGL